MALRQGSIETKNKILSVRVRLFLERGYKNTPISMIIEESGNGQYWIKCTVCRVVTAVTDMPRIFINGADIICPLKDYEFSFVLPDGCTVITAGYRLEYCDAEVTVTEENGEFSAKVNASNLKIGTMTVQVSAKLKDGFIISAKKEVTVQDHSGGEATCTEKAICDICGNEYGETDPNNHGKLTHIEEVKATTEKEGNIEYWYCEECGTSFKDSAVKEKAEKTVIPKLNKSESSGDEALTALILALLLSGGLLITLRKKEN